MQHYYRVKRASGRVAYLHTYSDWDKVVAEYGDNLIGETNGRGVFQRFNIPSAIRNKINDLLLSMNEHTIREVNQQISDLYNSAVQFTMSNPDLLRYGPKETVEYHYHEKGKTVIRRSSDGDYSIATYPSSGFSIRLPETKGVNLKDSSTGKSDEETTQRLIKFVKKNFPLHQYDEIIAKLLPKYVKSAKAIIVPEESTGCGKPGVNMNTLLDTDREIRYHRIVRLQESITIASRRTFEEMLEIYGDSYLGETDNVGCQIRANPNGKSIGIQNTIERINRGISMHQLMLEREFPDLFERHTQEIKMVLPDLYKVDANGNHVLDGEAMLNRQRDIDTFTDMPPDYFKVLTPYQRWLKKGYAGTQQDFDNWRCDPNNATKILELGLRVGKPKDAPISLLDNWRKATGRFTATAEEFLSSICGIKPVKAEPIREIKGVHLRGTQMHPIMQEAHDKVKAEILYNRTVTIEEIFGLLDDVCHKKELRFFTTDKPEQLAQGLNKFISRCRFTPDSDSPISMGIWKLKQAVYEQNEENFKRAIARIIECQCDRVDNPTFIFDNVQEGHLHLSVVDGKSPKKLLSVHFVDGNYVLKIHSVA